MNSLRLPANVVATIGYSQSMCLISKNTHIKVAELLITCYQVVPFYGYQSPSRMIPWHAALLESLDLLRAESGHGDGFHTVGELAATSASISMLGFRKRAPAKLAKSSSSPKESL